MSKRYILDDSDSECEDGKGGGNESVASPSNDDLFTDEEKNAINRCQIQINDKGGIYSHENMLQAIENVGMTLLEKLDTEDGDGGHRYRVKAGSHIKFFERDIYKVHDPTHAVTNASNATCSEEAILLEIEALRQSEKAIKNRMFKQKETGAMVVFGPWFNYAFQRLLQLTSSNNGSSSATTSSIMGEYTVVKIIRSLFSFITDDLKDIVKYGRLNDLKTKMGVDWLNNVSTARKVINHCGYLANFLHHDFAKVGAHVQSLMSKSSTLGDEATLVTSLAPAAAPVETLSDPRHTDTTMLQVHLKQEEAPQDKQMIARQKRMAAMKAQAMAANSVAPTETLVTAPSVANVNQKMEQSNIQSSVDQSHIPPQSTAGANSILGGASNGWGRLRDGSQETQPYRTKLGSWEMSMRILGTDIPVENDERKLQHTSLAQESFAHAPDPRSDDHDSSRSISGNSQDYTHRGGHRRENYPRDNNGQNGQGMKHRRSNDYDDRGAQPEKRRTSHVDNIQPERSAPVAASRNGVGRGRGATLPAWVTQQTIAPSNQVVGHVPGPSPHPLVGVSKSSNGQGRGRGRGANINLPAWMTANNP